MNFGNNINIRNSVVLVPRTNDPSSPVNGEIWYNSTLNKFRKYQDGVISDLDTTGSSTGISALKYVDQTPDNGTYGLLSGTVNGTNKIFTVSQGEYLTGKLEVYLNGIIQLQGATDEWVELNPAAGTFEFVTAPPIESIITVSYIIEEPVASTPTDNPVFTGSLTINSTTGGLLIPRMTTTQRNAISSPDVGLQIYNTTNQRLEIFDSFWGWIGVNNNNEHLEFSRFFTDFINSPVNNDGGGLTTASSGTGAGISSLTTASDLGDRPGIITLSTGTTTGRTGFISGFSYVYKSPNILMWESDIRINQLSNSTDGYALTLGFIPAVNTVTQRPAIMFVYDSEGALTANSGSPFWKIAANRSSPSVLNNYQLATGNITPSTGWTRLKIIVRDISSVPTAEFYIDETLVGSLTTQIPFEDAVRVGAYLSKNVGTTPATIDIDFVKVDYKISR
jgi:hypothetical protein